MLACKNEGEWHPKLQFTLNLLLDTVDASRPLSIEDRKLEIRKLGRVQALFKDLCTTLNIEQAALSDAECQEKLAMVFLLAPERLLWCDGSQDEIASFLGEPLVNFKKNGYWVAVFLVRTFAGLECSFCLPCSDRAISESRLQKFSHTAKVLSDSIFLEFRMQCCKQLRELGYDCKVWRCVSGASEHDLSVHIATSRFTDLCIAAPNCNRLSRLSKSREPWWLNQVCDYLTSAMKDTCDRAVCFIGDASLSPGVNDPQVYGQLVPKYQRNLGDRGVPVVSNCPGIVLDDGIHWSVTSANAVASLFTFLIRIYIRYSLRY